MKCKRTARVSRTGTRLMFSLALCLGLSSCGVTKATISKPAQGTTTTVTITTNNPITTTTSPNVDLNSKK